ncbi:hypothetical protein EG329_003230 [Mollisiaceae sp. DMI_Dod_QoI]|nr:hypothetical protein EG329_003230 [Helotiales sp. DMI_Dod_QoI]
MLVLQSPVFLALPFLIYHVGAATNITSKTAPVGADILTVAVIGDYGWTGWVPSPDKFCFDVLPRLEAAGITAPNEVVNDCDPGDKQYITNATALQMDTSAYVGQICAMKNCSAFLSVGDNFYDSGVDFTTSGLLRFQAAWVDMYTQGVFKYAPWHEFQAGSKPMPSDCVVTGTNAWETMTSFQVSQEWTSRPK